MTLRDGARRSRPNLETGALAIELHSYIKDLAAAEPLMLPICYPSSHFMRAAAFIADRKTVSSLAAASSCIVSVTWL